MPKRRKAPINPTKKKIPVTWFGVRPIFIKTQEKYTDNLDAKGCRRLFSTSFGLLDFSMTSFNE
jgi:hypothetical protein